MATANEDEAGWAVPTKRGWWAQPTLPVRTTRLCIVAIAVLGALVFATGLDGKFVFDDFISLQYEDQMQQVWPWGPIVDWSRWLGVWSFQWNYYWAGEQPLVYHAVNIGIHVAAGLTLFGLARRSLLLPGTPWWLAEQASAVALTIALLWLVHPLQTQSVTYVIQRYESLLGLCFLLVLYATLRGATAARPWRWYLLAAAAAWAGAGAKEVMVACPLVLLLYDRAFLAPSWRDVFRFRWPLHLAVGGAGLWLVWANGVALRAEAAEAGAGFGYQGISPWQYLRSQPGVILEYLRLSFWPDTLILDRGWPVEHSPAAIYGLGSVILLLLAASLFAWWKSPRLGWLGLSFFLILGPTSSIVPIADLSFEHRMYLPLAAVVALTVLAATWLLHHAIADPAMRRKVVIGIAVTAVVALSARTVVRNRDYADPIRLWGQVVKHNPQHARGWRMYGLFHVEAGKLAEAQPLYERSLALEPQAYQTWIEYATLFQRQGDFATARQHYQRAADLKPDNYRPWMNLGRACLALGDYEAAHVASQRALACDPVDVNARKQVAWLLATSPLDLLRDGPESLRLIDSIPQSAGHTDIQWQEVRAASLAECGRFDDAVTTIQRAIAAAHRIGSRRVAELTAQREAYLAERPWRLTASTPLISARS